MCASRRRARSSRRRADSSNEVRVEKVETPDRAERVRLGAEDHRVAARALDDATALQISRDRGRRRVAEETPVVRLSVDVLADGTQRVAAPAGTMHRE